MNDNINLIKESIVEYCENIFGECLRYMRENNINPDLSGEDDLTLLLRYLDDIQNAVKNTDDIDKINSYKDRAKVLSDKIRHIVG